MISAVGVVLDPVRTVHDLFANSFARAIGSVDILDASGKFQFPGIAEQRIHSGRGHGACSDLHPRARNFAILYGSFDVHIGVHRAFCFDIANRCKPVFKCNAPVARAKNGSIWDGLLEQLLIVIVGGDVAVKKDVRMQIDEPRQNRVF